MKIHDVLSARSLRSLAHIWGFAWEDDFPPPPFGTLLESIIAVVKFVIET